MNWRNLYLANAIQRILSAHFPLQNEVTDNTFYFNTSKATPFSGITYRYDNELDDLAKFVYEIRNTCQTPAATHTHTHTYTDTTILLPSQYYKS